MPFQSSLVDIGVEAYHAALPAEIAGLLGGGLEGRRHADIISSAIMAADYDRASENMEITFNDGSTYTYYGVPEYVFESFIHSTSAGSFFNSVIRYKYAG